MKFFNQKNFKICSKKTFEKTQNSSSDLNFSNVFDEFQNHEPKNDSAFLSSKKGKLANFANYKRRNPGKSI